MYNPYDNDNRYNENNERVDETPNYSQEPTQTYNTYNSQPQQPQQPIYNPYSSQQNSYTWSNRPPVQSFNVTVEPEQKEVEAPKKSGSKKFIKYAATCALSSVLSIGIFLTMIQTGFITVASEEDALNPAFTIAKVVSDSNAEQTSEVSEITKQEVAQKVIPSVVCIQVYQSVQSNGYFGSSSSSLSLISEGSGIIMSEDGYIMTNAHVIDGGTVIKVMLSNGAEVDAQIIGKDDVTDLAVIKIEPGDNVLQPAEFGSSSELQVADEVMAIGNPGGTVYSSSTTFGYVSALDRQISVGDDGYIMNVIQTDVAINPGNSGGALVNEYGQVIGITSSKKVATDYEGIGFAIPIDYAQSIISELKEYGYVKSRAVLGISGSYIDEFTASYNGVEPGMYVTEVSTQNAYDSGLMADDIITSIDGVELINSGTLSSILASKKPGDTVTIVVDRYKTNQEGIELEIVLSETQ